MNILKVLSLVLFSNFIFSQQIADTTYNPTIQNPAYVINQGPTVFIDEGHYNFHTKEGRYKAFSILLERDGYKVKPYQGLFVDDKIKKGNILVISNALNEINVEDWFLPTPSAFTDAEIETVRKWVFSGGRLFLIADHMPFPGSAKNLAEVFGIEFTNGFVVDTTNWRETYFNFDDETLKKNIITSGRDSTESINEIVSFTGQGFMYHNNIYPILVFNENCMNYLPDTAWVFNDETPIFNAKGLSQGAYRKYGDGRVVVFGEAAMFSAQLSGPNRIKAGMNSSIAPENYKLLLNIIHWLDGLLD
jgi:hypothetical protein